MVKGYLEKRKDSTKENHFKYAQIDFGIQLNTATTQRASVYNPFIFVNNILLIWGKQENCGTVDMHFFWERNDVGYNYRRFDCM